MDGAQEAVADLLLSPQEEADRAHARRPFANAHEGDAWTALWCEHCVRDTRTSGCPLLFVAVCCDKTPVQWRERNTRGLGDRYACTAFKRQHVR